MFFILFAEGPQKVSTLKLTHGNIFQASGSKNVLRPLANTVVAQKESTPIAAYSGISSSISPVNTSFMRQIRNFQTSVVQRDIDQAARYIGAGAATVGVAGSGEHWSR